MHLLNSSNTVSSMNIYSLTCTRSGDLSETTSNLLEYFKKCNITSKVLTDENSIFEAYSNGIESINGNLEDIVILCHDDIEILTSPEVFTQLLKEKLSINDTGFIGIAGTRRFAKSAVWWDMEEWKAGSHSGYVFHGKSLKSMDATFLGN